MTASSLPRLPWTAGRKAAALVFATGALAVLGCIAMYLSGVLFLLMNKTSPAQVRLTSIVHYWQLHAEVPRMRRLLQLAIGVCGGGLLVVLPAAMVLSAQRQRPLHGDARFATAAEVARSGLLAADAPAILLGRHRGRNLFLGGQLSVMLSAPTRSGKGVGVVIPNLLSWPHSVVVLDIKGENYDITAGFRASYVGDVYAFSPFDLDCCSHRWNPLTAVRADARYRVADLLEIGEVFYPSTGRGSSDAFFNDQARNLFLALGLLLLETPTLPRTIGEMLRQASGKGLQVAEHLQSLIDSRHQRGCALSDDCTDALQRLLSTAPNTQASIIATFSAPLILFADAVVDAATSGDDFLLEDLRRRRMSVYVRIPPNRLASARLLLTLFFSQLVKQNTQQSASQDPGLRYQCLLVNDEFAAMGRVSILSSAAAFLSGYNLRLLTIVQAMSQLDAIYGAHEARTFATNHGLQILYAPREQRDADEYSAMMGHYTQRTTSRSRSRSADRHTGFSSHDSDQRRALLLPQEFKELGKDRLVIVMQDCKPILGEKIVYHREALFQQRLLPPPPVPDLAVQEHMERVREGRHRAGERAIQTAIRLLKDLDDKPWSSDTAAARQEPQADAGRSRPGSHKTWRGERDDDPIDRPT